MQSATLLTLPSLPVSFQRSERSRGAERIPSNLVPIAATAHDAKSWYDARGLEGHDELVVSEELDREVVL